MVVALETQTECVEHGHHVARLFLCDLLKELLDIAPSEQHFWHIQMFALTLTR